jgi:twitching motility protein PilT
MVLEGILSQTLLPRADGRGRVMALEILVMTPAVRNLIREEKIHQIYSAMQAGTKYGMQTLNQSLVRLVQTGLIGREEALGRSVLPDEFIQLLSSPTGGVPGGQPAAGSHFAKR